MKDYQVATVLPLAFETLSGLGEARQEWVSAVVALVDAKRDLALANAVARKDITRDAGGPKALGSNAELRELALIIALEADTFYIDARIAYDEAFEREARAKQRMMTLNDTQELFRVVLA